MKQWLLIAVLAGGGWGVGRAQEANFSKTVRPEDFSAAGLAKLSPEELARLDALVRDFKNGGSPVAPTATPLPMTPPAVATTAVAMPAAATEDLAVKLAAAKREVAAAERARVAAEEKAAKAEAAAKAQTEAAKEKEKKSETSLLARAKVLLTPGTEIEYATVESRIAGDFKGWEGKTIFTLEGGARWQVANGGSYSTPPIPSPKVKIEPSQFGGFWMMIEGVKQRVRVVPVSGAGSKE